MERDSAVFYRSFYEASKDLPGEVQTDIYKAMFEYAFYKNEIALEGTAKAIFTLIKPQLDANIRKFENGKNGGRPPKDKNQKETKSKPKNNQKETKSKGNESVYANVSSNVNSNEDVDGDELLSLNDAANNFLKNKEVVEAFLESHDLKDKNQLIKKIKDFHIQLRKDNKTSKTSTDYSKHLDNWLNKNRKQLNGNSSASDRDRFYRNIPTGDEPPNRF